jgi:hypothetical protein
MARTFALAFIPNMRMTSNAPKLCARPNDHANIRQKRGSITLMKANYARKIKKNVRPDTDCFRFFGDLAPFLSYRTGRRGNKKARQRRAF